MTEALNRLELFQWMAEELVQKCGDCLWFKTSKCRYAHQRNIIMIDDAPCVDGLLIQFFGTDVIIKAGDRRLIKPLRFLSTDKAKDELMRELELDKQDVEEIIIKIKNSYVRRKKPQPKKKIEAPSEEDTELIKKAEELLKDPSILDKFLEHSGKWVVMDEPARKIELLTCVSVLGEYPLNLALQQVWSAGKTKTITTVARYFEDEDVWYCGAISPKALIHERGAYDEDKGCFVIDLRNKIIIFLDEPEYHTLTMLKPLLSHDKYEIMYRYVSKDTMKTIVSILRGFPACVFCAVKSKYTEEFTSRWFTASPQITTEKIRKVIELKGDMAQHPEKYAEDEQFKTFKKAFAILKQGAPYKVVIPYGTVLSQHFRAKKPTDMRFYELFLALIKGSCILHAYQREKDEQNRLIATMDDYENAKDIFTVIEKPTLFGVGQNVLDFYENVLAGMDELSYVTYEDLMRKYYQVYGEPISRDHMREEYLKPLEKAGLIDIADDPQDKRKKIITSSGTLPKQSLIDDEGFTKNYYGEVGTVLY